MDFRSQRDRECDKAIVELSRGEKEALSVIYSHCAPMICSVAKNIFGNSADVEDALQETMLRILKYAGNYRPGTSPCAWVLSIARNCAKDMAACRNLENAVYLDSEENESLRESLPDKALDVESFAIIHDALQKLSSAETAIVKLRYYYGFSFKEIASIMESNAVAVKKRYQRAINKLRDYYERESQ